MGRTLTTAAEIAGELLQLSPTTCYHLQDFNRTLLERKPLLARPAEEKKGPFFDPDDPHSAIHVKRRSLLALRQLLRLLREGFLDGALPDAFWGMAAISPSEFVAAAYLFALELYFNRK